MYSYPIWVRGYAPLPRFFCLQGLICLFCPKRDDYLLLQRILFILFLFFYYFLETFAHSCKGLMSQVYYKGKYTNCKTYKKFFEFPTS
ncbi:hypothetical protein BREVNS_0302 [Brevinematales bacterium NS]|nr:hypothetical protein BREVNS_0302 [Brevinematales bacterium NS]